VGLMEGQLTQDVGKGILGVSLLFYLFLLWRVQVRRPAARASRSSMVSGSSAASMMRPLRLAIFFSSPESSSNHFLGLLDGLSSSSSSASGSEARKN